MVVQAGVADLRDGTEALQAGGGDRGDEQTVSQVLGIRRRGRLVPLTEGQRSERRSRGRPPLSKFLNSILANTIQNNINKLIKSDQTGFITGREVTNNIRRVYKFTINSGKA